MKSNLMATATVRNPDRRARCIDVVYAGTPRYFKAR
jgi:hypothetical protein